ncbi:unknown [Firmicutes bacterium CAG:466]|nr:unknown [Firmicutes bacterium CAG:466]
MNITSCYNRLSISFAQFHNLSVHIFDIFHGVDIFHSGRVNHKFIVAQRLNFQIIIEMYQFFDTLFGLAVQKGTIQFPCFAGTAQNQAFPHLHEFAFGNSGTTEEIINMGHGNQFVQIPQTCIVLHQNDCMVCTKFFIVHRAAGKNIDFIQSENFLFCQHIQKLDEHFRCCFCVVDSTMMSIQGYTQVFTNNVQFVFIQFRQ